MTPSNELDQLVIAIMQGGFESAMGGTPFMSEDEVIAHNEATYDKTISEAKATLTHWHNQKALQELEEMLSEAEKDQWNVADRLRKAAQQRYDNNNLPKQSLKGDK